MSSSSDRIDVDLDGSPEILTTLGFQFTSGWGLTDPSTSPPAALASSSVGIPSFADVDRDGSLDLIEPDARNDPDIRVRFQSAPKSFDGNLSISDPLLDLESVGSPLSCGGVVSGEDLDRDGATDLVAVSPDVTRVLFQSPEAPLEFPIGARLTLAGLEARRIVFRDVDGDGRMDVIASTDRVAAVDLDEDGDLDLTTTGNALVLFQTAPRDFAAQTLGPGAWIQTTPRSPALRGGAGTFALDLDGDGEVDLVSGGVRYGGE